MATIIPTDSLERELGDGESAGLIKEGKHDEEIVTNAPLQVDSRSEVSEKTKGEEIEVTYQVAQDKQQEDVIVCVITSIPS